MHQVVAALVDDEDAPAGRAAERIKEKAGRRSTSIITIPNNWPSGP